MKGNNYKGKAMLSRRWFIGGAAAFGAFGGTRFAKAKAMPSGEPRLRFGVVSDIHIKCSLGADAADVEKFSGTFRHTLECFRDRGVDAVVIAGDLADNGIILQLEHVAATWRQVFPNDKAPDGRRVERLFVYGNHDMGGLPFGRGRLRGMSDEEIGKRIILSDPKGVWERVFDEPYVPIWTKEVRGYRFVGAQWLVKGCRGRDERFNDGIADFYAANSGKFDPSLPFFHVQHPHPFGTVRGSHIHGTWMGQNAFNALARHPNAISFSGHSHTSLTDERSLWQGAFTAIDTSTLRRVSASGAEENAAARKEEATDRMMPGMADTTMGRQGQFVEVYDDRIVLERREFLENESLGPDRVIPWPPVTKPFAPETLSAATPAPEFGEGDAARVSAPFDGKTRGGKPVRLVKISVPPARKGGRVYSYDIVSEGGEGQGVTKTYLQNRFFLTPRHWPKRNTFLFPADALAKGRAALIYPKNCFGRRGRPLSIPTSQHPSISQ